MHVWVISLHLNILVLPIYDEHVARLGDFLYLDVGVGGGAMLCRDGGSIAKAIIEFVDQSGIAKVDQVLFIDDFTNAVGCLGLIVVNVDGFIG